MDSRLTDGTIAEILMRHGELLQAYQNQIRELTEEYNTGNELIEITQLRSPRYGVVGKSSNQASRRKTKKRISGGSLCRNPAITGGTESSSAGISVLSASAEKAEGNLKRTVH